MITPATSMNSEALSTGPVTGLVTQMATMPAAGVASAPGTPAPTASRGAGCPASPVVHPVTVSDAAPTGAVRRNYGRATRQSGVSLATNDCSDPTGSSAFPPSCRINWSHLPQASGFGNYVGIRS